MLPKLIRAKYGKYGLAPEAQNSVQFSLPLLVKIKKYKHKRRALHELFMDNNFKCIFSAETHQLTGYQERQRQTEKEGKVNRSYRSLCSHVRCQWGSGWSWPCWTDMSCGLTWCCGPRAWQRVPETWCRLSLYQRLSPHWPSSHGVADPGQPGTPLHGMG